MKKTNKLMDDDEWIPLEKLDEVDWHKIAQQEMKTQKLTDNQLREAHVRMEGQAETGRKIKNAIMKRQNDTGRCSYCGKPSQGNFTIHRDGYCEGPEVPLCDECGDSNGPNLEEIWRKLALNRKSSHPVMDHDDEIVRLKARIAELELDNLNLIDQLRGQK